jgi:hypothetical protein
MSLFLWASLPGGARNVQRAAQIREVCPGIRYLRGRVSSTERHSSTRGLPCCWDKGAKTSPFSLCPPLAKILFPNGQKHNSTRQRTPVACRAQSAVAEEIRLNLIA